MGPPQIVNPITPLSIMTSDKRELGLKRIREILGPEAPDLVKQYESVSPDFTEYVLEIVYGEFYARKGLEDKIKEVAAVASLLGRDSNGVLLRAHLQGMVNVGHTEKDVVELLLFLIPYVGFPPIVDALLLVKEMFGGKK